MNAKQIADAILQEMPECINKWGIAFAVESNMCIGRTMAEVASKLGCSRAAISHKARDFCQLHNLKPSRYMKAKH